MSLSIRTPVSPEKEIIFQEDQNIEEPAEDEFEIYIKMKDIE